jgi:hypothetical protein
MTIKKKTIIGIGILIFGLILYVVGLNDKRSANQKAPVKDNPVSTEVKNVQRNGILPADIPEFKVVAQDKINLNILVPKSTTKEQLKSLIFAFRQARESNSLAKMIPPTTRGGELGDYAGVWILVFSEPDWASGDKLQRFIKSSVYSKKDTKFDKEYVKHIKAEYWYSSPSHEEYGNFGYDDGMVRSANYKKLF